MPKNQNSLKSELETWLNGATSVVIAGIGNEIRMDDIVGVKIIQDLQGKVSKKIHLIECETVPESFMDEIVALKPSHVLLIDAALLELEAGEATFVRPIFSEPKRSATRPDLSRLRIRRAPSSSWRSG